jgi:hypothetical protein
MAMNLVVRRLNRWFLTALILGIAAQPLRAQNAPLQITTIPPLFPAFDPKVTDYVIPAGTDLSVTVKVQAPNRTTVSVDGEPALGGSFQRQVENVATGQTFTFVVNSTYAKTYFIRRLPAEFPAWTTERPGTPQSEYYIFAPNIKVDFSAFRNWVIIADNYGVPIWWYYDPILPIDAKLMPDGQIGYLTFGVYPGFGTLRNLDGTLTNILNPSPVFGGYMDNHELLKLPNRNYAFIGAVTRGPVDASPFGGSASAMVLDNIVEEVNAGGELIWSWSPLDHIPLAECSPQWWSLYMTSGTIDPYHMNSVEAVGNSVVISMRHLDAILRVSKATGAVQWKLGGTPRPESLTFVNDPYGNFGGPHDARMLPDGTLTLHDNGANMGRPPRAVRYRIDTVARTATLLEQVTDPKVADAWCCGSARRLHNGNWVMGWGHTPAVTEIASDGNLVFRMNLADQYFSYRAHPVPYGKLRRADLRAGMDYMYPPRIKN